MKDRLYKDNGEEIKDYEWERAINVMLKNVPDEILQDLVKARELKEGTLGILHETFGREIRNLLRKEGFNWGAIALDQNWTELMEDVLDAWVQKRERS